MPALSVEIKKVTITMVRGGLCALPASDQHGVVGNRKTVLPNCLLQFVKMMEDLRFQFYHDLTQ